MGAREVVIEGLLLPRAKGSDGAAGGPFGEGSERAARRPRSREMPPAPPFPSLDRGYLSRRRGARCGCGHSVVAVPEAPDALVAATGRPGALPLHRTSTATASTVYSASRHASSSSHSPSEATAPTSCSPRTPISRTGRPPCGSGVVERPRLFVDAPRQVGRLSDRARPGRSVLKSSKRSLIATVRACTPARRRRTATPSASPSSVRWMTTGSVTSVSNVVSCPMLFSERVKCRCERGSRPHDKFVQARGVGRPDRSRQSVDRNLGDVTDGAQPESCAAAPPSWRRRPRGPTPAGDAGRQWCRTRGTTSRPSGLALLDASLATYFVAAAPTEARRPVSRWMRSRSRVPICQGVPSSRRAPATSRNASSIESGSTSGVTSPSRPHDTCASSGCTGRSAARARSPAGTGAGPPPSAWRN